MVHCHNAAALKSNLVKQISSWKRWRISRKYSLLMFSLVVHTRDAPTKGIIENGQHHFSILWTCHTKFWPRRYFISTVITTPWFLGCFHKSTTHYHWLKCSGGWGHHFPSSTCTAKLNLVASALTLTAVAQISQTIFTRSNPHSMECTIMLLISMYLDSDMTILNNQSPLGQWYHQYGLLKTQRIMSHSQSLSHLWNDCSVPYLVWYPIQKYAEQNSYSVSCDSYQQKL